MHVIDLTKVIKTPASALALLKVEQPAREKQGPVNNEQQLPLALRFALPAYRWPLSLPSSTGILEK